MNVSALEKSVMKVCFTWSSLVRLSCDEVAVQTENTASGVMVEKEELMPVAWSSGIPVRVLGASTLVKILFRNCKDWEKLMEKRKKKTWHFLVEMPWLLLLDTCEDYCCFFSVSAQMRMLHKGCACFKIYFGWGNTARTLELSSGLSGSVHCIGGDRYKLLYEVIAGFCKHLNHSKE